jgi:hypothetical protein
MTEIDFLGNDLQITLKRVDFLEKYVQILSNTVVFLGEKLEIEPIQTQLNQMKEEQAQLP